MSSAIDKKTSSHEPIPLPDYAIKIKGTTVVPLPQPNVSVNSAKAEASAQAPNSISNKINQFYRRTQEFIIKCGEGLGELYDTTTEKASDYVASKIPTERYHVIARFFQYSGVYLQSPMFYSLESLQIQRYTPILDRDFKNSSLLRKITKCFFAVAYIIPKKVITIGLHGSCLPVTLILGILGELSLQLGNFITACAKREFNNENYPKSHIKWNGKGLFKNPVYTSSKATEIKHIAIDSLTISTWNACLNLRDISSGLLEWPAARARKIGENILKLNADIAIIQGIPFRHNYSLLKKLSAHYPHIYTNIGGNNQASGLCIASKIKPLSKPFFIPYPKGFGGLFYFISSKFVMVAPDFNPDITKDSKKKREYWEFVTQKMKEIQIVKTAEDLEEDVKNLDINIYAENEDTKDTKNELSIEEHKALIKDSKTLSSYIGKIGTKVCILAGSLPFARSSTANDEYTNLKIADDFVDPHSQSKVTSDTATKCNPIGQHTVGKKAPEISWEVSDYVLIEKKSAYYAKTSKINIMNDMPFMEQNTTNGYLSHHRPLLFTTDFYS